MANDTCAAAIVISASPYTVHMDTSGNADDPTVSPPCGFSGSAKAAWWEFTNSSSAPVAVVIETDPSASHYHDISVWSGVCGSLTNVACENITYSGKGIRIQAIVPAGESRYILVTDDDFGTGVVFDLTVTATSIGTNGYFIASSSWALDSYNMAIINKTTGDLVGGTKPVGAIRIEGLAKRPSGGHILGFLGNNIWEFSSTTTLLSTTSVTPPSFTGTSFEWNLTGMVFSPAGDLYLLWGHGVGFGDHWALQKVNPTTFAVTDEWDDFGSVGSPTAYGIDNSSFYFSSETSGTDSSTIYKLNLTTGAVTTFGTYGSRTAGINPVGDFPGYYRSIFPLSNGKVYVTYSHTNASPETDGITLVVFTSGGSVDSSAIVDRSGGNTPWGTILADDQLSVYILDAYRGGVGPTLSHYTLTGTELLVGPVIGGDVLLNATGFVEVPSSVVPPTPPTLPPSVLVNSTPCCDTAGSTTPSAGPVLPPVNIDWIPSCTGGGLVPTTAGLVLTELWDY